MSIRRKNNKVLQIHLELVDCDVRLPLPQKNSQSDLYETDSGKRKKKQTGKVVKAKAKRSKKEQSKLKKALAWNIEDISDEEEQEQQPGDDSQSGFKTPADRRYVLSSPDEYDDDQRFNLDDTPMPEPQPIMPYHKNLKKMLRSMNIDNRRQDRETGVGTAVVSAPGSTRKKLHGYKPRKINYDEEE